MFAAQSVFSRVVRLFALTATFVVVNSSFAFAQNDDATIRGQLLDQQTNLGIVGARIQLLHDGVVVGEVRTDGSGSFAFTGEPAGKFQIAVSATGYGNARSSDVVVSGVSATTTVSLVLARSASSSLNEIGRVSTASQGVAALQTTTRSARRIIANLRSWTFWT